MSTPRSQLNLTTNSSLAIDHALSRLKKSIRTFNEHLNAFKNESQLLETIYYRTKNQHRQSLHFQKLTEMKRISRRIQQYQIDNQIRNFYSNYFSKKKKAWNFIPSMKFHINSLSNFGNLIRLFHKAFDIYIKSYKTFNQLLISLTFTPFALIIIGLIANLYSKLEQIEKSLINVIGEIQILQNIISPFIHDGCLFTEEKKKNVNSLIPKNSIKDMEMDDEDIGDPV